MKRQRGTMPHFTGLEDNPRSLLLGKLVHRMLNSDFDLSQDLLARMADVDSKLHTAADDIRAGGFDVEGPNRGRGFFFKGDFFKEGDDLACGN